MDCSIELHLGLKAAMPAAVSVAVDVHQIGALLYPVHRRPYDVLDSRDSLLRVNDINIQLAKGFTVFSRTKEDFQPTGEQTMGVVVVRAEILVIPLNGEAKNAIYLSAGHLHVLADVAVGNVAGVCPAETVSPLEHGFAVFLHRSNQRDHIGRVPVLQ